MTVLAVWLGVAVNRAREQREAVKAIEALGGSVLYDWQESQPLYNAIFWPSPERHGQTWLRRLVGESFFQEARVAAFVKSKSQKESNILDAIPYLRRHWHLERIYLPVRCSSEISEELKTALPSCKVLLLRSLDDIRRGSRSHYSRLN